MASLGILEPAPAFSNEALTVPVMVHWLSCPSLRGRRCGCGSPGSDLPSGPLTILEKRRHSVKVQHADFAPVWIEIELLKPVHERATPSRGVQRQTPPADHALLEQWMLDNGIPKYGRRRRHPQPSELVWIRADIRESPDDAIPWRLLFACCLEGVQTAALIHPERPARQALRASWEEVTYLNVEKGLPSALMPVFPLPDGTESPGWPGHASDHN